jgi:hypothetical protein
MLLQQHTNRYLAGTQARQWYYILVAD